MVLVTLQGQRRQLGQHQGGEPGLHQQRQTQPRVRREHQLDQLVAHALCRDDLDPAGHRGHRLDDARVDLEAELRGEPRRPHHPQRVVGEGLLREPRRPQDAMGEVDHPAVRVDELPGRHPHGHRVDGEVTATEVSLEGVSEVDRGLAGGRVVGVGAVRRDLHLELALAAADRAEGTSDVPRRVGPAGQQPLDLVGPGRGRQVEVVVPPAQHGVTDRTAHQGELVAGPLEHAAQLLDERADPVELGGHVALGVGQPDTSRRSSICCV